MFCFICERRVVSNKVVINKEGILRIMDQVVTNKEDILKMGCHKAECNKAEGHKAEGHRAEVHSGHQGQARAVRQAVLRRVKRAACKLGWSQKKP